MGWAGSAFTAGSCIWTWAARIGSRARARHIYGVVVTDGGDIDAAATATLRAATGP